MDMLVCLGRRIQSLRENRRMTQEDFEEKSGINARYLSAVECGKRNITIKTLEKIAEGLDVELYELFLFKEKEEPEQNLRKAIEKMLKEADKKKIEFYFNLLRMVIAQ